LPEFSIFRSVNEITGNGDFGAAPQRKTVNGGNYNNWELLQFADNAMAFLGKYFGRE